MNTQEITPEQTAQALEESIAHWERFSTGTASDYETPYSAHCPLCSLHSPIENGCNGCPVKEKTSLDNCAMTPWRDAATAWHDHGRNSATFQSAAKLELDFLKSLRKDK